MAKNRVQVDHSFQHLFDYSAIGFENRKSDLEITQCNDGMKPVQIPLGLTPENPYGHVTYTSPSESSVAE